MADVTLTEAQLNARTNHYLEKIGQGKPKAKGTKSNPYKGKDLTKLLKERFNNKNNNAAGSKNTPITKLPEMVEAETKAAEKAASKQLTYGEAHQIQNNISEKSKNALTNLRDNLAAEEAKAEQKAIKKAPKAKAEPKTWTKYAEEHGTKYEQPVSGVVEADRRAAQAIKENQAKPKTWAKYAEKHGTKYVQPKYEAPKFPKSKSGINTAQEALKQEALANAEGINKPFTTSSAKIDKQLGMGHKNPVSPNYAEEYGKLLDEKGGVQKNNQPKTWAKYAEEHGTKYEQPVSGVVEADKRAAEAIKQNKAKPKTWADYAKKHGTKYEQPVSGVVEADKRAAEVIKKNQEALKKQALENAEKINKPFTTSAEKIDKQLGIGKKYDVPKNYAEEYAQMLNKKEALENAEKINKPFTTSPEKIDKQLGIGKKYDVPKNYAEEYGKLMDEKYGKVDGPKTPIKPPIEPVNPGVVEGGKDVIKKGAKDTAKKPGFFKKIGNFFKGKKGKLALAAAAIGLLIFGLSKCVGGKKDEEPTPVPTTPTTPTAPTAATTPTEPTPDKYGVEVEEGEMPKSYTIQAGNYPSGIIQDTYGVAYGTPEYKEIQKAVYEASGYEPNTNLKAGEKFTLPDVTIGDKVYTADENAKVRRGDIVDNGLPLGHTKEVVKAGDKFYIVDMTTGQRVPNEPAFDDRDKACERIDDIAEEEKQAA